MLKKILIFALLLTIPFSYKIPQVAIAQTPTPANEDNQETQSIWETLWNAILNWFASFNFQVKTWFAKDTSVSCFPKSSFHDYENKEIDTNTRVQSESVKTYRKGSYLRGIIDGTFDDDPIAYFCNNTCTNSKTSDSCTEIKYSTVVYYFYKKGEKILYNKNDHLNPIDYNSEKMESYHYNLPANSDAYFRNLYENISQIPKGSYQGEQNTATGVSTELNDSLRTIQSAVNQTAKPSSDDSPASTEATAKDNEYQQRAHFSTMLPAAHQKQVLGVSSDDPEGKVLGISTDTDNLKQLYTKDLYPQSMQIETDEYGLVEREDDTGGLCTAKKSHCHGMSQYGALGMALSGKSYEEILRSYYGNIRLVKLDTLTSNLYIQVTPRDGDKCNSSKLKIEDYLKGLGEMPDYWGRKGDLLPDGQREGMNALRAQAIAARTYAYVRTLGFTRPICATSACQAFRCTAINTKPYFNTAVSSTQLLVMVDATTGRPFSSQYARSFCGPSIPATYRNSIGGISNSHTTPSFNGKSYEESAYTNLKMDTNSNCK